MSEAKYHEVSAKHWDGDVLMPVLENVADEQVSKLGEIAADYGGAMEANVQSAVGHLHTSISWTQVTLLGVLAVAFSRDLVDEGMLQGAAVGMAWMLIGNFTVRSAKNYVNIIRFNLLRRCSLEFSTGILIRPQESRRYLHAWVATVRDFYVAWHSPISRATVARKVLFEFGFLPAYAVILFLTVRLLMITKPSEYGRIVLAAMGVVLSLFELVHFFKFSPYMRFVLADGRLQQQA